MREPIAVDPHPILDVRAFVTVLPADLAAIASPADVVRALSLDAPAPLHPDDAVRTAIRDLFRFGGFKPAGRSKPSSEYLIGAAERGELGSINAIVDVCNAVSLHSGLPISVIDLDRAQLPLRIAIAPKGARYVFNASGQDIDLSGLIALWDAEGPCACGVKDSQRTKTHAGTRQTLSVVWGTTALPGRAEAATRWYRSLLETLGATVEDA